MYLLLDILMRYFYNLVTWIIWHWKPGRERDCQECFASYLQKISKAACVYTKPNQQYTCEVGFIN